MSAIPEPERSGPGALAWRRWNEKAGALRLEAGWERVLMLHYAMPPEVLRPWVPFELDVFEGRAYVSLVSFKMTDMRFAGDHGWLSPCLRPLATHEFLNVRAYVRHRGEAGIYFLAEWIPNRVSVLLGRPCFGLPYRFGRFACRHDHEHGRAEGVVTAASARGVLRYHARLGTTAAPAALTAFLMERYTAFTAWGGLRRFFRVWHEPWRPVETEAVIEEDTLSRLTGTWVDDAEFIGAHYAEGLPTVGMSFPHFC